MVAGDPPKQVLILGLSFGNLYKFKKEPHDTYIRTALPELPAEVILYSGDGNRAFGTDKQTGRNVFMIGLSIDDLDQFRQKPMKRLVTLKGENYGTGFDVLIFSGETEAAMTHYVEELIGPDTKVTTDERLRQ